MPKKTSTVVMLFGLTVTDVWFLLHWAFLSIMQASVLYGYPLKQTGLMAAKLFFSTFISTVPGNVGTCLTLCISVERLFSMLLPLKIRQYSSKKCGIIVVCSSVVFTLIVCWPNLILYELNTVKTGVVVSKTIIKPTYFGEYGDLAKAACGVFHKKYCSILHTWLAWCLLVLRQYVSL